jgi:hypothetical protein
MENPGEPFSPVVMTDMSEQLKVISTKVETPLKEEVNLLFEPAGSVLVVSEKKEKSEEPPSQEESESEKDVPVEEPDVVENEIQAEEDDVVEMEKTVSTTSRAVEDHFSGISSMGNWPLRVVKTESELNPPRAILGLPNGKEVVIRPGMQLVDEGLVVMSIGKRGVVLAKITANGDHAQIESITLTSLND